MSFLHVLAEFGIKSAGHVAPFLLRRYYTPARIADKVKVRVCGEGDGITLWGGELPYAQAWIEITNVSPFPIQIDRIYGHFWYGTRLAPFLHLKEQHVGSGEEVRLYLVGDLTRPQADYIQRNLGKLETKLTLGLHAETTVNPFELERELRTNNVRLNNFHQPNAG